MTTIPTEETWEESERQRLGLTRAEWNEATIDEDWDDPRPVIVMWGDSQETPSQRLERFGAEFLDATRRLGQAQELIHELTLAALPENVRELIEISRALVGPDVEDVDAEYIRAQAELIADTTEPIPGLEDGEARKEFILAEITRKDAA